MNRNKLTAAVRDVAEVIGYSFFTGSEAAMGVGVKSYPAVWLSPPVMKKSSGRTKCRDVYKIELRFIMSPKISTQAGCEEVWKIMEDDAFSFYQKLAAHPSVRKVSGLSVSPDEEFFLKNGEVTMSAVMEVLMFYYVK